MIIYYLLEHPDNEKGFIESIDDECEDHDDIIIGWLYQGYKISMQGSIELTDDEKEKAEDYLRRITGEDVDFPEGEDDLDFYIIEDYWIEGFPADEEALEEARIYTHKYKN